jgi:ATP-binding cassette subfamily B protein
MEHLMRGRTTLMIAHRLSTLENCDVRIQIEHGRIVSLVDRFADDAAKTDVSDMELSSVGSSASG